MCLFQASWPLTHTFAQTRQIIGFGQYFSKSIQKLNAEGKRQYCQNKAQRMTIFFEESKIIQGELMLVKRPPYFRVVRPDAKQFRVISPHHLI